MKILDLSGGFTGSWQTKKNKYILTFLQGITSVYPNMVSFSDQQDLNDPAGVFLKPSYTMDDLNLLKGYGYWNK